MMKTLILAIGHLKILKSKTIPAFSLLEIIVVISLISILSYFISFSANFISSKQNIKTVNEKIKLIELELDYLQKYALSINAFINLDANIVTTPSSSISTIPHVSGVGLSKVIIVIEQCLGRCFR